MSKIRMLSATSLAGIVALSMTLESYAQTKSNPMVLDLITHPAEGIVEQDVFIERVDGSGELYRFAPSEVDKYKDKMLFATRDAVAYEPFDPVPGGPYPIGKALNLTVGEWLAATGTVTYWCEGDKGTVKASVENLVPNGVYTVWYVIRPDPPTDPFTGLLFPMGKRDGSESVFKAGADGRAEYEAVVEPCLEMSGIRTRTVIGVSWHSDNKTYGFTPGAFGKVTHTQLNADFPREASLSQ